MRTFMVSPDYGVDMARRASHSTANCAVNCDDHGKTEGRETPYGARCATCGRFAPVVEDYCLRHDIDVSRLPHDSCPRCRQEREREQQLQERQARRSDPNMHNHVDAQANAIDHSRSASDFI